LAKAPETSLNDERRRSCDVLVIGAGPAGSMAAAAAAETGADVIMVDRRNVIGSPARCAGFVPAMLSQHVEIKPDTIAQRISGICTHTPAGIEETNGFGYIVQRDLFDQQLAVMAKNAGTAILTGVRATSHRGGVTRVRNSSGAAHIAAQVVIGADGPRSTVGKWIGSVNDDKIAAVQWTVRLRARCDTASIYFDQDIAGGYGWLFPRGDKASVGVAVSPAPGTRPGVILERFVERLAGEGLIEPRKLSATGGWVPVGGPLKSRVDSFLLAGDAAGHCHPVTGAGIALAVQSGEMAGRAAANYAERGLEKDLDEYEKDVDELFGGALRHAAARRRELKEYWEGTAAEFSLALRKAWIAFPEYHESI
jgi:geranylgeranyl reductase family protein